MARTKQTARKSCGGKAPRAQLSSNGANSFKRFMRTQQSTGNSTRNKKKIFINYENTFGSVRFKRSKTTSEFKPSISFARIAAFPSFETSSSSTSSNLATSSLPSASSSLFMRLDFNSIFDGNESLIEASRDPLDTVFVLDISGSMQSSFVDDSDNRCKLQVAKDCITKIVSKLKETDKASLVIFNDKATTLIPLKHVVGSFHTEIAAIFQTLKTNGGTNLSNGLCHGFNVIRADEKTSISEQILSIFSSTFGAGGSPSRRMKRVYFLTDMESSYDDELDVIRNAKIQVGSILPPSSLSEESTIDESQSNPLPKHRPGAKKAKAAKVAEAVESYGSPVFLSVICIGVDLSIDTVERISSVPGAKYCSVVNASELESTVAGDFCFDVTPIAFNIQMKLPDGLVIDKPFGSAELNNVQRGSTSLMISSEFAVPLETADETSGGIYLLQLSEALSDAQTGGGAAQAKQIEFNWTDRQGALRSHSIEVSLPKVLTSRDHVSPSCDVGLRKAYALSKYVDLVTAYSTNDDEEESDSDYNEDSDSDFDDENSSPRKRDPTPSTNVSVETATALAAVGLDALMALTDTLAPLNFPAGVPDSFIKKATYIQSFKYLRHFLTSEMEACGDYSLGTNNANILQTVDQIIEIETKEVVSLYKKIESTIVESKMATVNNDATGQIPRGFMCPVTLELMKDPVLAADGHSYERRAIEQWLMTKNTSPVTNLELPNHNLVPNFALRAAIEEYLARSKERDGSKP